MSHEMTFFRPEFHVTAEAGILSAPAGALLGGGTWHVFHQYRPTLGAPARWAHQAIAVDTPYSWDICNDILAPATTHGEAGLGPGSVISENSDVDVFFTSRTRDGESIHLATIDHLADTVEYLCDDQLAVDQAVTRRGEIVGDSHGWTNFRSPCVTEDFTTVDDSPSSDTETHVALAAKPGWLMLALADDLDRKPRMVVLRSTNRRRWEFHGELDFDGDTGLTKTSRMVSPRLLRLTDEVDGITYDVILTTDEEKGQDIPGYLVGRLHGTTFTVKTAFTRMDYGHDFTRPRSTNIPAPALSHSSALLFGLMNGVAHNDDAATHPSWDAEGWANCLTLPRFTTLQGGLLYFTPIPGLPDTIAGSNRARMFTGLLTVPDGGKVVVDLLDACGATAATVTHAGCSVALDRSMNHYHEGDPVAEGPLMASDTDAVTIIVDGSTVEVFADGGVTAMASRVYFDGGCQGFRVTTSGGATVTRTLEFFPIPHDSSQLTIDDEDIDFIGVESDPD